jgi:hypothetical protein
VDIHRFLAAIALIHHCKQNSYANVLVFCCYQLFLIEKEYKEPMEWLEISTLIPTRNNSASIGGGEFPWKPL